MNAMTWFDHETDSIWSQPVGLAFEGPLRGTQLKLLPFQLTTWSNWFDNYLPKRVLEEVWEIFYQLMAGDIEPVEYVENIILAKGDIEKTIEDKDKNKKENNRLLDKIKKMKEATLFQRIKGFKKKEEW